jgi:hypothetical protein
MRLALACPWRWSRSSAVNEDFRNSKFYSLTRELVTGGTQRNLAGFLPADLAKA